jgi:hypothetical protein
VIVENSQMPELIPCPLCAAGEFRYDERNYWTGRSNQLISVTLRHWCPQQDGKLPRVTIQVTAKTHEECVQAWNKRQAGEVAPQGGGQHVLIEAAMGLTAGDECGRMHADDSRAVRALLDARADIDRLNAENADLRARLEAAERGLGIGPESAYLVFFDDVDHGHETFECAGARQGAVARYQQASDNWTSCCLFAQIKISESEIEEARHAAMLRMMEQRPVISQDAGGVTSKDDGGAT